MLCSSIRQAGIIHRRCPDTLESVRAANELQFDLMHQTASFSHSGSHRASRDTGKQMRDVMCVDAATETKSERPPQRLNRLWASRDKGASGVSIYTPLAPSCYIYSMTCLFGSVLERKGIRDNWVCCFQAINLIIFSINLHY